VRPDERDVAGLTCSQVMAALSDYAEGEAPAELRAQIEAHVAGCRQCEQFGAGFMALLEGMRRHLGPPEAVEDAVVARVRAAITSSAS